MKANLLKLLVLFILAAGFAGGGVLTADPQVLDGDPDDYGKLNLHIIDAESGKTVSEVFKVSIFSAVDCNVSNPKCLVQKEKNTEEGSYTTYLKPGKYYLHFKPSSFLSEYEIEPTPVLTKEGRNEIIIKEGRITEAIKKVHIGGKLHIILVDKNGNKIIPGELFEKGNQIAASISCQSPGFWELFFNTDKSISELTGKKENLDDGEAIIGRLFPGKYNIHLSYGSLGIVGQSVEDIEIFRKQTTEQKIVVDLNPVTGIKGYVLDQDGNPLEGLRVYIQDAVSITGKDGFYRLVGIKEGMQKIRVRSLWNPNQSVFFAKLFKENIIKNKIIEKNLILNTK